MNVIYQHNKVDSFRLLTTRQFLSSCQFYYSQHCKVAANSEKGPISLGLLLIFINRVLYRWSNQMTVFLALILVKPILKQLLN